MKSFRSSDTARLIARSIILASKDPDRSKLVSSETVDFLTQILGKDCLCRATGSSVVRRSLLLAERFLLPGIITHYLARKIHLEREVEKAISEGCRRVIVLGAGYDTLAWRLQAKHPQIEFVEIDHPATQQLKADRLSAGPNLKLKALDLTSDLPSSQMASDGLPTIFVLEGLTMYFSPGRVEALMKDVSNLTGKDGKVIWSFMEKQSKGSLGFQGESRLVPRWLRFRGEPFLWGISRDGLEDFSSRCGLKTEGLADHRSLRREVLKPCGLDDLPLARGELICTSIPS